MDFNSLFYLVLVVCGLLTVIGVGFRAHNAGVVAAGVGLTIGVALLAYKLYEILA